MSAPRKRAHENPPISGYNGTMKRCSDSGESSDGNIVASQRTAGGVMSVEKTESHHENLRHESLLWAPTRNKAAPVNESTGSNNAFKDFSALEEQFRAELAKLDAVQLPPSPGHGNEVDLKYGIEDLLDDVHVCIVNSDVRKYNYEIQRYLSEKRYFSGIEKAVKYAKVYRKEKLLYLIREHLIFLQENFASWGGPNGTLNEGTPASASIALVYYCRHLLVWRRNNRDVRNFNSFFSVLFDRYPEAPCYTTKKDIVDQSFWDLDEDLCLQRVAANKLLTLGRKFGIEVMHGYARRSLTRKVITIRNLRDPNKPCCSKAPHYEEIQAKVDKYGGTKSIRIW